MTILQNDKLVEKQKPRAWRGFLVCKPIGRENRVAKGEERLYAWNDDPQPQVLFTLGFSNLKPAPSRVST